MKPRLITIPASHYCEKARWALEYAGVPFREEGHVPLLHWRASFGARGGRTVPVLVSAEGVLADSSDILRFADRRAPAAKKLYPDAESAALEDRFDEELGVDTRRLGYWHGLPARDRFNELVSRDVPKWEALVLRVAFPLIKGTLRRGLSIDAEGARRSLDRLDRTFAEVEARLADGRRYLTGDRFTAADLTFASLAALLLAPREHPYTVRDAETPTPLRELRDRLRETRAGQYALRMYAAHR